MAGNSNVVFVRIEEFKVFSKIQKNQTPQVFFLVVVQVEFVVRNSSSI